MHGKLLRVEVFNPAAPRNTDLRILEELNVGRSVNLDWRNENIVDVVRLDSNSGQRLYGPFGLFSRELAAFAKPTAPTSVQLRKVGRRASVDNGDLTVAAYHNHPKIQLDPVVPMTHPIDFRPPHVTLAHL